MAAFGLPVALQAPAGGPIDRGIARTQSRRGADSDYGVHEYHRGRDEYYRHETRHESQGLLQDDAGDSHTLLDPAGKYRNTVACMELVVTMHVFVEQAHVERITDAGSESADGEEPVKIHHVREENGAAEANSERDHERAVIHGHALQHRARDGAVFDRVGIGERGKKREHGCDTAHGRQCHQDRKQLQSHQGPALAAIEKSPDCA